MCERKKYDIVILGRETALRIEAEAMDGEIRATSAGYVEDASPAPGKPQPGHFLSVPLNNAMEPIDFYAVYADGSRKIVVRRGRRGDE